MTWGTLEFVYYQSQHLVFILFVSCTLPSSASASAPSTVNIPSYLSSQGNMVGMYCNGCSYNNCIFKIQHGDSSMRNCPKYWSKTMTTISITNAEIHLAIADTTKQFFDNRTRPMHFQRLTWNVWDYNVHIFIEMTKMSKSATLIKSLVSLFLLMIYCWKTAGNFSLYNL